MFLKKGQKIESKISKDAYIVKEKIGEGGQGIVYIVTHEKSNTLKALKWYNREYSNKEQHDSINRLISDGLPKGDAGKRFIWPQDIITDGKSENFGYIMELIDREKYASLNEVWAKLKPTPNFKSKCNISYELSNSYRQLHIGGNCYRDISINNFVFNQDGEILICDNDNVGVNNQSESQMYGTLEFMAPEIINHTARPTIKTDLHSLAVLLFHLWGWHHPLEGGRAYKIKIWDIPAKIEIFGKNPIFIFDTQNKINNLPDEAVFEIPKKFWNVCPDNLKKLFIKSFTEGLKNPEKRVKETEWQNIFIELFDSIVLCHNCHAENFWIPVTKELYCWHCKKRISPPAKLNLNTKSRKSNIVIDRNTKLLGRHLDKSLDGAKRSKILGEIVANPQNPSNYGLKNLTNTTWKIVFSDNKEQEVAPGKAIPLRDDITIDFGNSIVGKFEI